MRRPPYFLPRRFLMRLKKNSRNPTNNTGTKGKNMPNIPPKTATTSSITPRKAVETPADELPDRGRNTTPSTATRAAIARPATSPGAAPASRDAPGSYIVANRAAPATALRGIMAYPNAGSRARTLSRTISRTAIAESAKTRVHPNCKPSTSGASMNPSRTNRASSASGTKALTPATEARPTPNPARTRLSTASIISRPKVDRSRLNLRASLGYTCLTPREFGGSVPETVTMDKIVAFCKRRGFVYQSSEIYGGLRSSYDYGPLGVEMKRNIKEEWWRRMIHMREDMVGLDSAIIMHPKVWEASGHTATFNDMLVESRTSKRRYRADHLIEDATGIDAEGLSPEQLTRIIEDDERVKDPVDGGRDFAPVRPFNLMFETYMGPVKTPENLAYLRPETAQGIFVNFKNVFQTSRVKVPFGIAQIGKSFRNEITPGNFIFRTREFEQMEMEFFVEPGTDEAWHEYWIEERWNWYTDLGLKEENLRRYEHPKEKLSHYSKRTVDLEYDYASVGWSELEGIANRTDFDLKQHAKFSGENLEYFDQTTGERYIPYVIEPAVGPDRIMLAYLVDAYTEEEVNGETRTVLKLHPRIAPTKAAVFPLSKKEPVSTIARELYDDLKGDYRIFYDDSGSIGRRYRRQDEAGTPFCVTVDFDTIEDKQVTIRDRDTLEQERVPIEAVRDRLKALISG